MSAAIDRLVRRFRGRQGRAWAGSVEDLLYEGERVDRTVEVGGNRVVVTSHRVLALTPGRRGENFRDVDLPNVDDVRPGYRGEENLLWQGGRLLLFGVVFLAVGLLVDFSDFVPTDAFGGGSSEAAGRIGVGGMLGAMNRFMGIIANFDRYALFLGAGLVAFSIFVFGVYVLTRDRTLVIAVAGDDGDIHVQGAPEAVATAVEDLEAELFGSGPAADGVSASAERSGDPFEDAG